MLRFLMFALVVALATVGCDKVDKFTQFRLNYDTKITIPATGLGGLPQIVLDSLLSQSTPTNAETSFQSNSTAASLIEEIRLEEIALTVTSPSGGNLDFLKAIEIYIKAPNLGELKIAEASNIANGLTSLNLTVLDNNLKEYIKSASFSLRAAVTIDGATTQDTEINFHTRFFVDAQVLGV